MNVELINDYKSICAKLKLILCKVLRGKLFGGTVPPNNPLFGRTVPPNNRSQMASAYINKNKD